MYAFMNLTSLCFHLVLNKIKNKTNYGRQSIDLGLNYKFNDRSFVLCGKTAEVGKNATNMGYVCPQ